MKKLVLLILLFVTDLGIAQTEFNYKLIVNNTQGKPDVNRDVVFIETSTYERLAFKTDATGSLAYAFKKGKEWSVTIGEMRNCFLVKTPSGGEVSRTIPYNLQDYLREREPRPDRRTIAFNVIEQKLSATIKNNGNEAIITILLKDQKGTVFPGIEVAMTCFESKTQYKTTTNAQGQAIFQLPLNSKFDIDIDGVESIHWYDTDNRPVTMTQNMLFQKKTFTETVKDGYIVQQLPADAKPSSSHAHIKLTVNGGKNGGINEDVYLRMLKSNDVYKAKTNDQGVVDFLLPIRGKYMVDFTFQHDADVIDLSQVKGIGFQTKYVQYVPDPRLENIENFIPKISNLILYDVQQFVDKQYPEPATGDIDFYLQWGNKFNENSKEALLEVGLKTKSNLTRKSNIPLNISFVIDKSGSMMGYDRIDQLKKALVNFISQLRPTDIVSIVVFDDEAVVAVPAQKLGDKKSVIDIIHAIQADGGTVIYDGMVQGFAEVSKNLAGNYMNRVVLLTDGYDSYPPEQVVAKAKENIKKGIELSTIGVGMDYNQALLAQLASAGGGMLHFAGDMKGMDDAFQKEMESILYPMAKKAQLSLFYNDQLVYKQLFGYENEVVKPGNMQVPINHLFPGLNQMALVKFDLINTTQSIEKQPVKVQLKYTDAVTEKEVILEKSIPLEWTTATGNLDMTIDKSHKQLMAVAIVNQSLKNMANAYELGNETEAQNAILSAKKQLKSLFPTATPYQLLALTTRLDEYVKAFETLKSMRTHK